MAVYTGINDSSDYFSAKIYTGNGGTQSVTGIGNQPDLVWIKSRVYAEDHQLTDSVRGVTKSIQSNLNAAESTIANGLTAFNADGFTVGDKSDFNYNNDNLVSYNWKAGTTSGLATDGSSNITPASYSFSNTAKMSIIKWVGTGVDGAYLPHGLGVVPEFFVIKNLTDAEDWVCYHVGLTNALTVGSNQSFIELNSTAAQQTGTGIWYSTVPSSVNVRMANDNEVNASSDNYIGYFYRSVKGYSKFGSYIGNDDADNAPFIYTGFKPAFVMIKDRGNIENWFISDDARSPTNPTTVGGGALIPNSNNAETTTNAGYKLDMLSNGFKPRADAGQINGDGPTYIYCALAENPFVTSDSIPTTAR